MRFRLEVIHTDGVNEDPPPFESQDIPDLDDPGTVLLFNAALSASTKAAADYLSWGRDKKGVIAGAADVANEMYRLVRETMERQEARAEAAKVAKPPEPVRPIRRKVARVGSTSGLLLEPLQPIQQRSSGLVTVGVV